MTQLDGGVEEVLRVLQEAAALDPQPVAPPRSPNPCRPYQQQPQRRRQPMSPLARQLAALRSRGICIDAAPAAAGGVESSMGSSIDPVGQQQAAGRGSAGSSMDMGRLTGAPAAADMAVEHPLVPQALQAAVRAVAAGLGATGCAAPQQAHTEPAVGVQACVAAGSRQQQELQAAVQDTRAAEAAAELLEHCRHGRCVGTAPAVACRSVCA